MNCDRYVGTGLVEVAKPGKRLRRTSSAGGSYFNGQIRHKLAATNQKQLPFKIKTKDKTSMHPNSTENSSSALPGLGHAKDNKGILMIEETKTLLRTTSVHQKLNKTHSYPLTQNNISRRHSLFTNNATNEFSYIDSMTYLHKNRVVSKNIYKRFL